MAESSEHGHHIISPSTYIKTFGMLTILMIATIAAAQIPFPHEAAWASYLANGIALTIAVVKATLVMLNFMGVRYTTRLAQMFAVMGFLWVTLMGITFCDYLTRHFEPNPGWEKVPPSPNTQMPEPRMQNPYGTHEGGESAAEH